MKKSVNQILVLLLFSIFLVSCGKTIDLNTSDKDYVELTKGRKENFVFKYKGVPFDGKVKNINGENRLIHLLYNRYRYDIPSDSYKDGNKEYYFNVTPEILTFKAGRLDGEYSLTNFRDEVIYVVKFSKGKLTSRIKNGVEEDLSKQYESVEATETAVE